MQEPIAMSQPRALLALFVDFANLRQGYEELPADGWPAPSGSDTHVAESSDEAASERGASGRGTAPTLTQVARALARFAEGGGRVGTSRAYADWSRDPDGPAVLTGTPLEPILVPATEEGEDRSHIRLVVDAVDALHGGDDPDAIVLVSDDPTLVPLVRASRAKGSQVIVVTPMGSAQELATEADLTVPLVDVVRGGVLEPVRLRPARAARARPAAREREERREGSRSERRPARRERRHVPLFDAGPGEEPDFSGYEWTGFVRLIDELEERLPFVGVRYLVNKVLAPHNCAIADPRLKRDLINEAVDQGIIELYTVGNLDQRLDPVTACRLDRNNPTVGDILDAREAEARSAEDEQGYREEEDYEPFQGDLATMER